MYRLAKILGAYRGARAPHVAHRALRVRAEKASVSQFPAWPAFPAAVVLLTIAGLASPAAHAAHRAGDTAAARGWRATSAPRLITHLSIDNGASRFAGDDRLLTTISPNGDGFRDGALIRFGLLRAAGVRLEIVRGLPRRGVVFVRQVRLRPGIHTLAWAPLEAPPDQALHFAGTFVARLSAVDPSFGSREWRSVPVRSVIRVQTIDAAFDQQSFGRGDDATLLVSTDATRLTLQIFRSGQRQVVNGAVTDPYGVSAGPPIDVSWVGRRSAPQAVTVRVAWPTGLYYAKLTADDGRVGYAPLVVRPDSIGGRRVAVVLPTNTWQAYNFEDVDGDGRGDTWYATGTRRVRLDRHYQGRGMPPHFRAYDLNFLRWLDRHGYQVDYLAEADLERAETANVLADAYDLIIFPGHHEYVTSREWALITGYRDLGGNLMFLAANNFYWRVVRHGAATIERIALWRDLGTPETRLLGVQYVAGDRGRRKRPWLVIGERTEPWLFAGTGLHDGSNVGLGGIEIDARASGSPPQTHVVAVIRDLFGLGRSAEMTYYETPAGARVFSAGAFTLGGEATWKPIALMLDNLWRRLSRP
jgi:hypothetical protein